MKLKITIDFWGATGTVRIKVQPNQPRPKKRNVTYDLFPSSFGGAKKYAEEMVREGHDVTLTMHGPDGQRSCPVSGQDGGKGKVGREPPP